MGAGQFAMSFTQPIDHWFAAHVGSGAIATLGYANRIISLGMALGATVIARATLPIFSEGVARGDSERIRRYALGWAGSTLLVGIVGAALLWLIAPSLVAVLFERGAFSSTDTREVAEAMRWGVWQLAPYLAGLVLVSHLASEGRYQLIGAIASANILIKLFATSVLAQRLGVNGILLATVVMYALSASMCCYAVLRIASRSERASP
jgi:peptidoglycan biosynthesis protein MviN/MurJ (putative lipid II flippase)